MRSISIIIPMYNSFERLKYNLERLENINYKGLEVCIIDDCSIDNSYEKAKEYSKKSNINIKVLKNQKNSGPGFSRNRGIKISTGEYITFVDSDDYLESCFFKKIEKLLEEEVDCIIFDYNIVSESGKIISSGSSIGINCIEQGFLDRKKAFVYTFGSTCGKIYKKSIIDKHNIKYGEFFRNEDMPFTKYALAKSKKIFYLKEKLYNYVQIKTSLMHDSTLDDEKNCQNAFLMLSKNLSKDNMELELKSIELREVLNNSLMIMIGRGESIRKLNSYVKENYKKEHINNIYFKNYPIYVKIVSYLAYIKCFYLLELIWRYKKWKKERN